MNLNLILFCALIILATCTIYFIPVKSRKYILLLLSLSFFMIGGKTMIAYAFYVIAISYIFGFLLRKYRSKMVLLIGICLVLLVLILTKYINSWMALGFAIPMGLSYYTLMAIGYLVDVYRGENNEKNLINYSLYLTFFPQIMAGPIGRSKELLPQWSKGVSLSIPHIKKGFIMFFLGLFEKIVLADNLGVLTDHIFDMKNGYSSGVLFIGILLYTLQIYFDFAGYSLIAIGGARMIGIELMDNFKSPFFSRSIREFWRRWHISLSSWFRDYVYFPLGGSRVSVVRADFNVLVIFIVSGIWHGTTFGFALWGLLHGIYLVVSKHTTSLRDRLVSKLHINSAVHGYIQSLIVFALVAFAFIPFRLNDFSMLCDFFGKLFTVSSNKTIVTLFTETGFSTLKLLICCMGVIVFFVLDYISKRREEKKEMSIYESFARWRYAWRVLVYCFLFILVLCVGMYGASYNAANFIYGQF